MKFKDLIVISKPKNFLFLGFFVLLSSAMVGQFYVSNHDFISVESNLSIQEQFIYFNSDVYGEGQIIFNSKQNQFLFTKENTQLPSLVVQNTSQFTIHNAITIHGDLNIAVGHLNLHNTIFLKGQLHQDEYASIEGIDLIILQTHIKKQPSPLHFPQNDWSFKIVYTHLYHTSNLLWQAESKPKPAFFYTSTTPHGLAISIPTPPPEYRG